MIPLIGTDGLGITQAHANNSPIINPINGKILMVAIDASSMALEAEVLKEYISQGKAIGEVNPELYFVNLAQSAKDINDWCDQTRPQYSDVWNTVASLLGASGFGFNDVQVAWIKFEDLIDNGTDDGRVIRLFWKFVDALQLFKQKFPNLKKVYWSARSFMDPKDPANKLKFGEPLPKLNELAVKMLVQEQEAGNPELDWQNSKVPWVSDIVNLYTNGYEMRADGYIRTADSYKGDGIHPSPVGTEQVATYVYNTLIDNSNFFAAVQEPEIAGDWSDPVPYKALDPDEYQELNNSETVQETSTSPLLSYLLLGGLGYYLLKKRKKIKPQ